MAHKPSPRSSPAPDKAAESERSGVRARSQRQSLVPRPASGTYPTARGERIDQKIRLAQTLLEQLPESDARGRLLRVAILRRDEVLLDGILAELQGSAPQPLTRRRFSSHPQLKKG